MPHSPQKIALFKILEPCGSPSSWCEARVDLSKARTVTTELWECKSKLHVGILAHPPLLTFSVLESLAGVGEESSESSSVVVAETAREKWKTQF